MTSEVALHGEVVAVIAAQPVHRGEPHEAIPVLGEVVHHSLGQAILDGDGAERKRKGVELRRYTLRA